MIELLIIKRKNRSNRELIGIGIENCKSVLSSGYIVVFNNKDIVTIHYYEEIPKLLQKDKPGGYTSLCKFDVFDDHLTLDPIGWPTPRISPLRATIRGKVVVLRALQGTNENDLRRARKEQFDLAHQISKPYQSWYE